MPDTIETEHLIMMTRLSDNNNYPVYLWDQSKVYRGCILVAEQFEGRFYAHYFDQFGDAAIIKETPCNSIEDAIEIARMTVDDHMYQAILDGEYLLIQ